MRAWVALLVLLAACGIPSDVADDDAADQLNNAVGTGGEEGSETGSINADSDREDSDRGEPNTEPVPENILVVGEVPEAILRAILDDAMARTGLTENDFEMTRGEAVTWPDGSLGCPTPGEAYITVITPGYWVELTGPGVVLDYRADTSGNFKLCEGQSTPHTGEDSADAESSTGEPVDPSDGSDRSGGSTGPPGGTPDS